MTGALPFPDDMFGMDQMASADPEAGGGDFQPMLAEARGGLPQLGQAPGGLPGGMSPETRKLLLEQIRKFSQPVARKPSLWSDPAFLAGLTLLSGGNMGQAGMTAAKAGMMAEQNQELSETRRATALSSLTGRLAEADKGALADAKARREATAKALALVPPTKRGQLGKLITDAGIDPSDPLAVQKIIDENGIPLMPNLKAVQGIGVVDMTNPEAPKVVLSSKEGGGPFAGNAEDIQLMNYLLNPKSDPSTPEYAMAHWKLTQPKPIQVPNEKGELVWQLVTPELPPNIRRPVIAGPAPAAPGGGVPVPAGQPGAPPPQGAAPAPGVSMRPIAPPQVDKVAKAKMDEAIAEAATISNALDDYVKAFEEAGVGERMTSVAGVNTPSNTSYSNAALLAKGEQLYNLGVLNGPDLTIIQKTLADPSTLKGQAAGPEAARAAADAVRRLIQDRISAKRKQLGLEPIDIGQYGRSLRATPGSGAENRFSKMTPAELGRVDVTKLSPEDLQAFVDATK